MPPRPSTSREDPAQELRELAEAGRPGEALQRLAALPDAIRADHAVVALEAELLALTGDRAAGEERLRAVLDRPGASLTSLVTLARAARALGTGTLIERILDALMKAPSGSYRDGLARVEGLAATAGPDDPRVTRALACLPAPPGPAPAALHELSLHLGRWARAGWRDLVRAVWEDWILRFPGSADIRLGAARSMAEAHAWEAVLDLVGPILAARSSHMLARSLESRARRNLARQKVAELDLLLSGGRALPGQVEYREGSEVLRSPPTRSFRSVVESDDPPSPGDLALARARYQLELGDLDPALRALQDLDRSPVPFCPALATLKGRLWALRGHPDLALEEFSRVSPGALVAEEDQAGLEAWAQCLLGEGYLDRAAALMRQVPQALRWPRFADQFALAERGARTLVDEEPPTPESTGDLVAGTYRILERIGRGGMAEVYRVENIRLGRQEALKILPEGVRVKDEIRELYLNEGRTLAALAHPHVIKVHATGVHDGRPWLAMELLTGVTLGEYLRTRGRPGPELFAAILTGVGIGLRFVHASGIVHRDVKPDNIMLVDGARDIRLMDFGLAADPATSGAMKRGELMGTLHYISPEQINGLPVDGRSDLYSLGALAYEMIAGRPPFDSPDAHNLLYMHLTRKPAPLRPAADVSEQIEALVLRCLEKDPALRPARAGEFLDLLNRATRAP